MNNFSKLINFSEVNIERGSILRCNGKYPYEKVVDFLVVEAFKEGEACRLIVASGYKAGLTFRILPIESFSKGSTAGINTKWMQQNWMEWGYEDCPLNEVLILLYRNIHDLPPI